MDEIIGFKLWSLPAFCDHAHVHSRGLPFLPQSHQSVMPDEIDTFKERCCLV